MDKMAPRLRENKWPGRATSAKDAARVWERAASAIGDFAELEHGGAEGDRERGRACHRLWRLVPCLPEAECSGVSYGEKSRGDWATFLEQLGYLGVVGGRCKYDREQLGNWADDARRLARACRARQTKAARQKFVEWLHQAMRAGAADGHRAVREGAAQQTNHQGGGGAPRSAARHEQEAQRVAGTLGARCRPTPRVP